MHKTTRQIIREEVARAMRNEHLDKIDQALDRLEEAEAEPRFKSPQQMRDEVWIAGQEANRTRELKPGDFIGIGGIRLGYGDETQEEADARADEEAAQRARAEVQNERFARDAVAHTMEWMSRDLGQVTDKTTPPKTGFLNRFLFGRHDEAVPEIG